MKRLVSALVLAAASTTAASAQIAADLTGRVLDGSGASIANAQLTLTEVATGIRQDTTSSSTGDYAFSHLKPGGYRLDVTAPGFEHLARTGLTVILGQTVNADLALHPGGEQQTVTVNADAPPLQSSTSDIQTNIPGGTVIAMPLNSRNFIQLTTLAPGVELPPAPCCPASTVAAPAPTSTCTTASPPCSPSPARSPSSPSSTTSRSSLSRPTTSRPSSAASTAVSSTSPPVPAPTPSTAASSSSSATKTSMPATTSPHPLRPNLSTAATSTAPLWAVPCCATASSSSATTRASSSSSASPASPPSPRWPSARASSPASPKSTIPPRPPR
ncbi:carboxypeptidase-like regulatory domain-containing protein [Acidipila sp. EB88]|uniref:carboxypeptidase-like regulatory domain-containing protein n=1 Tax=Acidipila sp. EB88 TaxID=2305226 RepID=UPI001F46182E|nr:carboxypeptidase-like regulatory domain-containing protein [Acidipila sp. EB88]